MGKAADSHFKSIKSKKIVCISWHSSYPMNTGSNVRINKILANLRRLDHIFLAPEPIDKDLNHFTFRPFHVPDFINIVVPFNLEILGCSGSKVEKQVTQILNGSNIGGVFCIHLWSFKLARKLALKYKVPLIVEEQVVESLYAKRTFSSTIIAKLTAIYEQDVLKKSDIVVTVSEFDKNYLADRYLIPKNKIWVVPNGISLPEKPKKLEIDDTLIKLEGYKIVAFLGKTSVGPNRIAINTIKNKILPKVRSRNQNMVFIRCGGPARRD